MSIVDEIRVKQSYGPEGYKFEVMNNELVPYAKYGISRGESIQVTLQNIPLVFFGDKIPSIEASTIAPLRKKVTIASSNVVEHYDASNDIHSYRANVEFYIPACELGKSISFYLDGKLLYIGIPREHRWTLIGKILQLNCQEMRI